MTMGMTQGTTTTPRKRARPRTGCARATAEASPSAYSPAIDRVVQVSVWRQDGTNSSSSKIVR